MQVRADWGWLDFRNTKVTSWNTLPNAPNTRTNGRAFIHARSTLDIDGYTAHESRMDVSSSEICFLGYQATEAYGLVWKVVDTTATNLPPGSTNTLFDLVNVYGDILNSHIHDNFFGVYTYGAFGCHFATNVVNNNWHYGFDPHDDSDYMLIENNLVYSNGWHGIIASKRCDHGILRNNISFRNGLDPNGHRGNGIMLHRSSSDRIVTNNVSYNNHDSGIAIFGSDRTFIANNICSNNANAGIRLSVGCQDTRVQGNQFLKNGTNGVYLNEGDDIPDHVQPLNTNSPLKSGQIARNTFTNNLIKGFGFEAIKVNNSDSNVFAGNTLISSTTNTLLRFEDGTNNMMIGNIVPKGTFVKMLGTNTGKGIIYDMTTIKSQPALTVQFDNAFATGTFADDAGAIFTAVTNISTTAGPGGSSVNLNSALMGLGPNQVTTLNFNVVPAAGNVLIHPTTRSLSGSGSKSWTAKASSATVPIGFTVGNPSSGATYKVTRGGVLVATVKANSKGVITFSSTTGTTK